MIYMKMRQLAEELEPMPEVGDHYAREEILLPRADQMARDLIEVHIYDAKGEVMGRAHANPILDTKMYQVEFTEGVVT